MTRNHIKSAVTLLTLALGLAVAQAQTSPTTAQATTPVGGQAATQPSEFEKFVKDSKKLDFTWGADVRVRNEYFNNAQSLNEHGVRHEFDYFRFRERIWASLSPTALTNLSLNARFSGEQREWMKDSTAGAFLGREGFEERYGILDNAYVKYSNIADQPLTLTAGRQDILLGDYYNWWLVADGTPGDGSWTFFLDSVRLAYEAKDIKTKFDAIYIYQNALPDAWVPTVGESGDHVPPYILTEQNEQGVILYASNKSVKDTQIDGYFIYKRDDSIGQIRNGDNADIYTLGAKITGNPAEHWKYSAEGAYQFGHKQDPTVRTNYLNSLSEFRDISAFGVNAKVSYLVKDKLNNQGHLIYEFLSGDDPSTKGKDEMFDVLWGRWPRWSEMYIYSYINETSGKIGQMNNLHRIGAAWTVDPIKNKNFSATYSALLASEKTPTRATATSTSLFSELNNPGSGGIFRGHYLQTVLRHKFNDHLSGHLWAEFEWMGDYYTNKDLMTFLRAEVLMTW